ncbi:MAG: cysteine--tRNA ligase [Clostridia bacterium]|nr:cysteine--tRNA ligase [Clostridia bacterium]
MRIFNTLTRQKEEFKPITPGEVKMYACGPTVYNFIHIGNARPLCVFDTFRRYLEYRGWKVTFVQNFTDIDDKIINRANAEGTDYLTISNKYIDEYKKDAGGLNIREATIHPRATENIDAIIDIITTLIEKGYAYESSGDVYYRTLKFKEYGKLSHQPLDDLMNGARISAGENKEEPMDFALWKSAKPGEPAWESPWGMGRPGWHIECSAMSGRYLGKTIDIHAGGQDLIFPHHENEIAQSEACNGCTFANYWMHNGFITVDNVKMSKSLGNFFTVRDVAEKFGYEPIRYLMLASHYRSPINYSFDAVEQCKTSLERLYNCRENLEFYIQHADEGEINAEVIKIIEGYKQNFIDCMDDDFNTAAALGEIFDLVREINTTVITEKASKTTAEYALKIFNELVDVFGLLYVKADDSIDAEVESLIAQRQAARAEKNWAEADRIRDLLKEMNIVLEDTPQGVKWHKA